MKIAVGCDHAGFPLKNTVLETVRKAGHETEDCGTFSCERADYPDYAGKVARLVAQGKADRGILICGSGVGMCIAANKVKGVRACVCHDAYSAQQSVEHDGLNILCLGARIIGTAVAEELVQRFLGSSFLAGTRHEERLNKVKAVENANFK
jgi:ribose 5-phosphate isomerase B